MEKVTITAKQAIKACEELNGSSTQTLKKSVSRKFLEGLTKENDLISAALVNFIVAAELTQNKKLKAKLHSVVRHVLSLI